MEFHASDPSPLIEATFQRILEDRMDGLPLVNERLAVAAVGFARQGSDWRGVLVTPWGIGLLLLPAVPDWPMPDSHTRTFREYPSGTFAFLGNREEGLGDYLLCPLVHDTLQIPDQATALATARACLLALDTPREPPATVAAPAAPAAEAPPVSASRRRFLSLGS